MKNKRIIIVEDDAGVRKGLAGWLSHEYELVNFESAEKFLESLRSFDFEDAIPTAMLLDFQMPGMTGVELQTHLHQLNVKFPIIFMSGNAEKEDVIDAWRGGAVDFILKPFSGDKISEVINLLFEKIDSTLSSKFIDKPFDSSPRLSTLPITQREAEVLMLLGKGHRQNEVAQILGISLRTVKMYRGYIKNKLSLNTPVQLSRFCDQHYSLIEKLASNK